ncbi:winged helix-turn-helix transcriptional regulator [Nocardioides sp. CER19]|uniref:winged helix-turn-helix transcriptional regulator n=1 Tax=Nocardioides sp. CER19 TaxID=3038538 RepID=UPI002447F19F|nr:winged helix-turn-helix transcriptional regulator [Nocardioides sp. CER19]MDH2414059.1 winged helix-turn-helix transcriptional regulator [Nocardioides sp. CER19]
MLADDCVPFGADCYVRLGASLIAHTWDPVALAVLREGPRRRRDLLSAIGDISDKSLHESLGRLVAAGLVARGLSGEPTYDLTPLGRSFASGPLLTLARWAEDNSTALAR